MLSAAQGKSSASGGSKISSSISSYHCRLRGFSHRLRIVLLWRTGEPRPAILTLQALVPPGFCHPDPPPLDVPGAAGRASPAPRIKPEIGMAWRPGLQLLIDALQQTNVLGVIAPHPFPCLPIPCNALPPDVCPHVPDLPPHPQVAAEMVKLVGVEFEVLAGDLERVHGLVGGGWGKPVDG